MTEPTADTDVAVGNFVTDPADLDWVTEPTHDELVAAAAEQYGSPEPDPAPDPIAELLKTTSDEP